MGLTRLQAGGHMARLDAPDLRRGASVVALLAVAAIGLRARDSLSAAGSEAAATAIRHGLLVFFGFMEGLAVLAYGMLLVMAFRRGRRKGPPEDNPPNMMIPWWARVLGGLVAIAMVTVPAVLLVLAARGHRRRPALGLGAPRRPPALVPHGAHVAADSSAWWLAGLAAVGVAAVALALSAWRRQRQQPGLSAPDERPARDRLSEAASAGAVALHSHADPRTAIIACYAIMERSLTGAGSPPAAADTPAEVLDRAFGPAHSAAAETLTGLFRQARYSDHALAEEHRTAALTALDRLRADLGEPAGAGR
jgi:Domain of unknown function (DUF4129)